MSNLNAVPTDQVIETTAQCPACTDDTTCNTHQPKLKRFGKLLAKGSHKAGAAVIDFNLRDIGTGAKSVARKLPKVQIVRENSAKE